MSRERCGSRSSASKAAVDFRRSDCYYKKRILSCRSRLFPRGEHRDSISAAAQKAEPAGRGRMGKGRDNDEIYRRSIRINPDSNQRFYSCACCINSGFPIEIRRDGYKLQPVQVINTTTGESINGLRKKRRCPQI